MSEPRHRRGAQQDGPAPVPAVPVTVHESQTGHYVFVESGNHDAWIASDVTMPTEP